MAVVVVEGGLPELGLDAAKAAEDPLGVGEGIDEGALFGGGGLEAVEIFVDEGFEFGVAFVEDDEGAGVHAGFERIHAGGGFTGLGAGAGGFGCVATICFDLFGGGHRGPFASHLARRQADGDGGGL